MAYNPILIQNEVTELDEDTLNYLQNGIKNAYNVSLIAISNTAPSECSTGDMYYNTTDNKIYTATATDTWGEVGTTPISDILYVILEDKKTYTYNGTTLVELKTPVKNSYSESEDDPYSANYVNNAVKDTYSTSETKTNKVWIDNKPIYRKVFQVTVTQNLADTTIPNSFISNIDTVINVNGILKNAFGNVFPLPNVSPNGTLVNGLGIFYHATEGIRLRIGDSSLGTGAEAIAIIEYTKTT